jgi:hypothetical protein
MLGILGFLLLMVLLRTTVAEGIHALFTKISRIH